MLVIEKLREKEIPPYHLLNLADPSDKAVKDYLERGECYIACSENKDVIGVYVLLRTRPFTIELVNVAVDEEHQGKGYGRKLVEHAIEQARLEGFDVLEVGTGNSSTQQLALYQKAGFNITSIDYDFFRKHYAEPIWENDIECRHMIRMSIDL